MQQEASTYLAVSRAFGDRSLKTPTALVSCDPEVTRFQVQDDDLFLVMACDGVWDVLSNQEVVDIASPHFQDAKAAASAIVTAAYTKDTTAVRFGWKVDGQVQDALKSSKIQEVKSSASNDESSAEEEIDVFSNE